MGLFDFFKKKKELPDFSYIDSMNKAREEYEKGNLERIYLIAPKFGGSENEDNTVYVPLGIKQVKEGYDNTIAHLIKIGYKMSYNCKLEYKNGSVIPSKIYMITKKNGEEEITNTTNIW